MVGMMNLYELKFPFAFAQRIAISVLQNCTGRVLFVGYPPKPFYSLPLLIAAYEHYPRVVFFDDDPPNDTMRSVLTLAGMNEVTPWSSWSCKKRKATAETIVLVGPFTAQDRIDEILSRVLVSLSPRGRVLVVTTSKRRSSR